MRCCVAPHGWMWCSARTTSGRCRHCWTAPGITRPPRSRSSRPCRNSRRRCRPPANPPTPLGFRSPSGATTPARSASSPRCGARRSTAGPVTCSPRCAPWSTRASSRSRCWGRTSMPTGSRSPIPISRAIAGRLRNCCVPAGASTVWSGCDSPLLTRPSSPTTSSRRWRRRRMCARPCTCRCSPDRTACCGRCAARIAPSGSCPSSTRCARPSRTPRSPPT